MQDDSQQREPGQRHSPGRTTPPQAPGPGEGPSTRGGSLSHTHHTAAAAPLGHTHGTPQHKQYIPIIKGVTLLLERLH